VSEAMTKALARYRAQAPLEWGEEAALVPRSTARLLAILDTSSSMDRRDAGEEGTQRRVDVLKEALDDLAETFPGQVEVIGFGTEPFALNLHDKLRPAGSTNLYKALVFAEYQARAIGNVVLVGDGQPTDGKVEEAVGLVSEWKLAGVRFSVIYCGPEGGRGAKTLQRLAEAGGGDYSHCRVKADQLLEALSDALLIVSPGTIQL